MQLARRIMIAGGALAFALFLLMAQVALTMLGVMPSVFAVGLDIPNTAFFLSYLLCVFVFVCGVVAPMPKPSYQLSRR
jgi:hypothetical protein